MIENIRKAARDLRDAQEQLLKAAENGGKQAIFDLFASILRRHPDVECVSWVQYTPYFNDGDACVFSVGGFCIVPKDEESDWQWEAYGAWDADSKVSEDAYNELRAAWMEINSTDLLEAFFGDHVRVTITRAGGEVDEYEHD